MSDSVPAGDEYAEVSHAKNDCDLDGATQPGEPFARCRDAGEFAASWNALTPEQREVAVRRLEDGQEALKLLLDCGPPDEMTLRRVLTLHQLYASAGGMWECASCPGWSMPRPPEIDMRWPRAEAQAAHQVEVLRQARLLVGPALAVGGGGEVGVGVDPALGLIAAVEALSVCQGGEELYADHVRYCVPFAEQRDALVAKARVGGLG